MRNSCSSIFPNTRASKEQEGNKIKHRRRQDERRDYEKCKRARKKTSPGDLSYPIKLHIHKHNMVFYEMFKNYNEIQLIKIKMDLNNRKIKNLPPSPERETVDPIHWPLPPSFTGQ